MNKLKVYDKLCVILFDPDRFGGTAFCPKLLKFLSKTALRFVSAKGRSRFCPKPLVRNLWSPNKFLSEPLATISCTPSYSVLSLLYIIQYCSSKQTQNDMIFLLPESRVSHVCSEADSHQGRGGVFFMVR